MGLTTNNQIKSKGCIHNLVTQTVPLPRSNCICQNFNKKMMPFFKSPESFESMSIWYKRKLGKNSIENMMQTISKLGGLTQIYTNHSIRATACTVLAHNNITPNDIINVTGHKDPNILIPDVPLPEIRKENK